VETFFALERTIIDFADLLQRGDVPWSRSISGKGTIGAPSEILDEQNLQRRDKQWAEASLTSSNSRNRKHSKYSWVRRHMLAGPLRKVAGNLNTYSLLMQSRTVTRTLVVSIPQKDTSTALISATCGSVTASLLFKFYRT
jgi:hypothetical protein